MPFLGEEEIHSYNLEGVVIAGAAIIFHIQMHNVWCIVSQVDWKLIIKLCTAFKSFRNIIECTTDVDYDSELLLMTKKITSWPELELFYAPTNILDTRIKSFQCSNTLRIGLPFKIIITFGMILPCLLHHQEHFWVAIELIRQLLHSCTRYVNYRLKTACDKN